MCEKKGWTEWGSALAPVAVLAGAAPMLGLGTLLPYALFSGGAVAALMAGLELAKNLPKSHTEKVKEVFAACSYKNKDEKYPVKLNKSDRHLTYELPVGRCPEEFERLQPYINSHLKAETEIYTNNGQLHVRVMDENLPSMRAYSDERPPKKMSLPIPIGQSRAGFIWADLASLPHLVVAGETFGGKSNFLHRAIAELTRNENVKLHIVDLKKVEFGYLRNHAELAMALPDAARVLESLCFLMMERMDLLLKKGRPNVAGLGLGYHVLIIDELSQMSPSLATDKEIKEMRKACHQMLTDLLCMARALGIHVIVCTQRPDKDILPGQLKANIPAALSFKVKSEVNSRIVLGENNDKAFHLPRIKGRAIWQWDVEREVQVEYMPVELARKLLPKVARTKPPAQAGISFDGKV